MTPAEYRAKAILHLESAEHETDLDRKTKSLRLALSYARLADLADKNAKTDMVYETPPTRPATQPVQQQQQQQQQQAEPDKE